MKMDRKTKLEVLEQYGKDAFSDVPERSALKGKEFCGYLYSPYFFRRHIGHQFALLVTLWGLSDRTDNPIDFIACGGKTGVITHTKGVGNRKLIKKLVQETTTLAVLEQHGDEIFEERKQFLPLELVNSVFGESWLTYKEAAKKISEFTKQEYKAIDSGDLDEYRFKYALAGYFYWKRNQIAFGSGSTEEFEKAKAEIPTWTKKQLVNAIKELADELVKTRKQVSGDLNSLNVF